MRAIDADALQLAIVEEGQANKRKKYVIGDIWELTGAEIRDVINSQPTIQPEPHWIPVTDRLPEKFDYYLVSGINSVWFARYESERFLGILSGHALDTVIAWMPLPEPYKGVSDGRD